MKNFNHYLLVIIGLVYGLFLTPTANAALIRETLPAIPIAVDGPDVFHALDTNKNLWVYTAPDASGIQQVFYQWVDQSDALATPSPAVQLTFNTVSATKPKFGNRVQNLVYAASAGEPTQTCSGILFYYLADVDADSYTELRMGCIDDNLFVVPPSTSPRVVDFDYKLTGFDDPTGASPTRYKFNVKDYDVSKFDVPTTTIYQTATVSTQSFPVVFTDADNKLHMLMFKWDEIYEDESNIKLNTIVYDYTDPTGFFIWDSAAINTGAEYFTPVLDPYATNILYSVKTTKNPFKQLGFIVLTGRSQYTLTNLTTDVINPKFQNDIYPGSNFKTRVGTNLFFEVAEATTRLAYMPAIYSIIGLTTFCGEPGYITNDRLNRTGLSAIYDGAGTKGESIVIFEQKYGDGKSDLYMNEMDLSASLCNPKSFGLTPATTLSDFTSSVYTSKKLTCMNNNTHAAFLPSTYHDAKYNLTGSKNLFLDIVFQRELSDGSGTQLAHAYDADNDTTECVDTCYETSTGLPILDSNGFMDGDGYADSCETVIISCEDEVLIDLYSDSDGDKVANNMDNCPCVFNPDQADVDADGWGDACDSEFNECGMVDADLDGVFDLCDACPADADMSTLAFDNDGDGILDSCTSVNPCGTVDTDSDGAFDGCDVCPNHAEYSLALPFDIDEDGTPDSCVASPCGTVDTDSDGVFDFCDACPNNSEQTQLTFDLNGDSINDSCLNVETVVTIIEEEPELPEITPNDAASDIVGGFLAEGGMFCSLNTRAERPASSGVLIFLSLAFGFGLAAKRRQTQNQESTSQV